MWRAARRNLLSVGKRWLGVGWGGVMGWGGGMGVGWWGGVVGWGVAIGYFQLGESKCTCPTISVQLSPLAHIYSAWCQRHPLSGCAKKWELFLASFNPGKTVPSEKKDTRKKKKKKKKKTHTHTPIHLLSPIYFHPPVGRRSAFSWKMCCEAPKKVASMSLAREQSDPVLLPWKGNTVLLKQQRSTLGKQAWGIGIWWCRYVHNSGLGMFKYPTLGSPMNNRL